MQQPPRPLSESLVGGAQLALAAGLGVVLLALCLVAFLLGHAEGVGDDVARTLAILALTVGNLALVASLARRGRAWVRGNGRAYLVITLGAAAIIGACIGVPALRELFDFGLPTLGQAARAMALGLVGGLALELLKPLPAVQRILGRQARPVAVKRA